MMRVRRLFEIMRYASGKLTDRFHFLRLTQLVFRL